MVEVFDILNSDYKKASLEELVFLEKRSTDYILSIPHGGTFIPVEFKHKFNIGKLLLIKSDLYSEELYDTNKGIKIVSRLNKNLVNVCRFRNGNSNKSFPEYLQCDPLDASGLIKKRILKERYLPEEKQKILIFYDLYHTLIEKAIEEMKQEYSRAIIFECHSMTSKGLKGEPDEGKQRPDFEIGTFNGKSAHSEIVSCFYETLKSEVKRYNLTVEMNGFFKGGYIIQNYGRPRENIHTIQLEVNKSNYMNEGLEESSNGDFTLKKEEFRIIKSIVSKTIEVASKEAKRIENLK